MSWRFPGSVARVCVAVLSLLVASPSVAHAQGTAGTGGAGVGGYWLVGADGGVYSYGGAPFEGAGTSLHLREPIVGMAATADGFGYWLAGRSGGIYSFGDAAYYGSPSGLPAAERPTFPVVGIQPTLDGRGYWVLTSN